jgi:hypothetical protein
MGYVTMVKVKFNNELCFDNFMELIKCKVFCFKGIDFQVCDSDDDQPKSEAAEPANSGEAPTDNSQFVTALKRAVALLNEALGCRNNDKEERGVCCQCREAIKDFLSSAPKC